MTPAIFLATVLAGALGAVARYLVTLAFSSRPTRLPWAVLAVNIAGSAIGGVLLGLVQAGGAEPWLQTVLVTGFAGGLTTFSTFSVETVQLVAAGRRRAALVSVAANLVLGIGAAALGYLIAR